LLGGRIVNKADTINGPLFASADEVANGVAIDSGLYVLVDSGGYIVSEASFSLDKVRAAASERRGDSGVNS
jgi:hypothetical protein